MKEKKVETVVYLIGTAAFVFLVLGIGLALIPILWRGFMEVWNYVDLKGHLSMVFISCSIICFTIFGIATEFFDV